MTTIPTDEAHAGLRVDAFLAGQLENLSRSAAARLIADGLVTLAGGTTITKSHRITPGEVFEVTIPDAQPVQALPQDIPLEIAFEDDDVVVVNKPRGMVVHPAPGHADGTLVNALLNHCGATLSGVGGKLRPGIVHRIDRDTSGLIIVAKNDFAHAKLAAQLADHSLSRVYEAVVRGNLKDDTGTIDAPLGRHRTDRKRQSVSADGRRAVTHYEVLARYRGFTHVRLRLETGRTHQIRVHMSHIGHPVLGDEVYGGRDPRFSLGGQCLHARALRFIHPRTSEEVRVEADLPQYFNDTLEKIRRLQS